MEWRTSESTWSRMQQPQKSSPRGAWPSHLRCSSAASSPFLPRDIRSLSFHLLRKILRRLHQICSSISCFTEQILSLDRSITNEHLCQVQHWFVQATKLKHQLTYEQRRDLKADVAAAKAEVKKIQENLGKLEEEARKAAEAAEEVQQELAAEVRRDPPLMKTTSPLKMLRPPQASTRTFCY